MMAYELCFAMIIKIKKTLVRLQQLSLLYYTHHNYCYAGFSQLEVMGIIIQALMAIIRVLKMLIYNYNTYKDTTAQMGGK